jgi:hypothetical protein
VGVLVSQDVIKWLLETEDTSVKYRTLTELLDKSPNDSEVKECKREIAESVPVRTLLSGMHPTDTGFERIHEQG